MLRDLRYPSLALALSLFVGHAHAQVIIDDILPVVVGVGNQGSTGLPVVANYDASGSDKLVVVYGTEHAFGINAGMVINSIEYNGTPMIEAVQENTLPGATAIFYLDNPGPAGEIRIIQGNQNGGRATVYALSNVAPGVEAVGQSIGPAVDVTTTTANSLVLAGILDGGQASNGNGAGFPTAAAPLVQDHSDRWGNAWAGFCSGHQFVATPGLTTSTFVTSGLVRLRSVAVAFADGCATCANGAQASVLNLGGGTHAVMSTTSTGGLGVTSVPLNVLLPACSGTILTPNPLFVPMPTDPAGTATLNLQMPVNQALCGATVTGQYAEFQVGVCELVLTDGIAITIGN